MVTAEDTRLRVLIVDDHPVVRDGLRAMLETEPGIDVVAEAGNGEEAIEKANLLEPDVVLTDIRMPGISGIEVTRRIKACQPGIAVILLTMYDSEMYVLEALRVGAAGYLVKDSTRELLCHTIKSAVDGGTMVRSSLLKQAIQNMLHRPRQLSEEGQAGSVVMERFTVREMEVLRLVALGYPNREIAGELHLAEVTVKKYVGSIIAKLGVSDRTQAAILAVRSGLVQ